MKSRPIWGGLWGQLNVIKPARRVDWVGLSITRTRTRNSNTTSRDTLSRQEYVVSEHHMRQLFIDFDKHSGNSGQVDSCFVQGD